MDGDPRNLCFPRPQRVIQRFLTDRPIERRALYWRDTQADSGALSVVDCDEDGRLHVGSGGRLCFDTYFNGFFESHWRRYTALDDLSLRITVCGPALLRLYRHALDRKVLVGEQRLGSGETQIDMGRRASNFRQHGLLTIELIAVGDPFVFEEAAWLTRDRPSADVGLAAVFCTFDREADIARVLLSLGSDVAARNALARVIVVNQGRRGILDNPAFAEAADHLGGKLTVIEQANFGGAGGFSRGLLTALADPAVTHAVLLDDDLELEPDSMLRMAAFYASCEQDVVVGGHMLDLLHPTYLYEAGALISDRHWDFLPQHFGRDIAQASALGVLTRPYPVHYNGWWCCGIPLSLVREHGLPLPCFIRGDDLEFGLRLHTRDVATVPMPGIAVWHQPFYLKLGGWQLYYETRNMLVASVLHRSSDRNGLVRRMARQVVRHLLTYRYYSTALILEAIDDFLDGPSVMLAAPLPRHASLGTLQKAYPPAATRREVVVPQLHLASYPRGRVRCLAMLGWLLTRNALSEARNTAPGLMSSGDVHWLTMRNIGHAVVETWWDDALPTYRRCRVQHRRLLGRAVETLVRLFRETPRAAAAWRAAAPSLTSVPAWNEYLGTVAASAANVTSHPVLATGEQRR